MTKQITIAAGLALALSVAVGGTARPAAAGPKGRLNTTLGLGAGTAVAAATGHKEAAVVLGAGTVASYVSYRNAVNAKRRDAKAQRTMRVAGSRTTSSPAPRASRPASGGARPVVVRRSGGTRVASVPAAAGGMRQVVTIRQPAPVEPPVAPVSPAPVSSSAGFPAWVLALLGGAVLPVLGYGLYRGLRNAKATA
jgi:hypothetical protein